LATLADDPRVQAASAQQLRDRLGGPLDGRVVEPGERHRRDADQPLQVGADAGHLPRDGGAQIGIVQAHGPDGKRLRTGLVVAATRGGRGEDDTPGA